MSDPGARRCSAKHGRLGTPPGRTLVVGDTIDDVAMGRAADMRTCAVTYGAQTQAELLIARPNFLVDRFEDALAVIGQGLGLDWSPLSLE